MDQLLSALPQLAGLIEKGGVVGVMLIACGALVWEIKRGRRQLHDMRNELANVYGQRDRALLMVVKCKTICEANKITVDLSDVKDLIPAIPVAP